MKNTLKILAGIILILAIFPFIQFMAEQIAPIKYDFTQLIVIFFAVAVVFALFFSGVFMFRKVKF